MSLRCLEDILREVSRKVMATGLWTSGWRHSGHLATEVKGIPEPSQGKQDRGLENSKPQGWIEDGNQQSRQGESSHGVESKSEHGMWGPRKRERVSGAVATTWPMLFKFWFK